MKFKEDKFLLLIQKPSFLLNFCLLLLYSLVSGIYKIADNQILMLLNVPIILFLLKSNCNIQSSTCLFYKYDLFFLLYVLYLLFLEIVVLFNVRTNFYGLLIGLFLDVFPIIGFIYSRKIKFDFFVNILLLIALLHLFIGILLYPPFGIYLVLGSTAEIFVDQMLFGRMSSVSGSLAFGNLMMYGCIISFFYNRKLLPFLLFGLIFSSQRSSWGGFLLCILLYAYQNFRTGKYKSVLLLSISLLFVGLCVCCLFDFRYRFILY
jgi:membrane protein